MKTEAEVFRKFNTFGIYIISLVVCGTMLIVLLRLSETGENYE